MTEKTYTPPPVTGYRTLTQSEVDLMNRIKAKAEECGLLVQELRSFYPKPDGSHLPTSDAAVQRKGGPGECPDQRWVSIGATDLQTGFMALVRAVAQPTSF